jgi:hypothetical protein
MPAGPPSSSPTPGALACPERDQPVTTPANQAADLLLSGERAIPNHTTMATVPWAGGSPETTRVVVLTAGGRPVLALRQPISTITSHRPALGLGPLSRPSITPKRYVVPATKLRIDEFAA